MDVRASDADRDQAAESLRAHCVAGRLTTDELEERLERAYAATTVRQLADLHADLPTLPVSASSPVPAHRRAPVPVLPGQRPFHERIELESTRAQAVESAMVHIAPKLFAAGYQLDVRTDQTLCFVKPGRRPIWTIIVAILLFPFGLLALLVRDKEERVVLSFDEPRAHHAVMSAEGTAPATVRAAFRGLR